MRLIKFSMYLILPFLSLIYGQDSLNIYKLDKEIITTTNRIPTAFSDVARTVTVIKSEEIQNIPAQSIPYGWFQFRQSVLFQFGFVVVLCVLLPYFPPQKYAQPLG